MSYQLTFGLHECERNVVCLFSIQVITTTISFVERRLPTSRDSLLSSDCSGVVSNVFTRNGEGFYLSSPSEFVRYSLSARFIPKPMCMVELKEGMRKPREEPPVVELAVESEALAR